jgi:hypothetical protein
MAALSWNVLLRRHPQSSFGCSAARSSDRGLARGLEFAALDIVVGASRLVARKGGTLRVEKRHDQPVVGVQQLRQGMGFVGRRKPRSEAIGRWRRGQRLLVVQGLGGLSKPHSAQSCCAC